MREAGDPWRWILEGQSDSNLAFTNNQTSIMHRFRYNQIHR